MPSPVALTPLPYPLVDPLAEAVVRELRGAVTIARYVVLPSGAVDAQIVAVTPEAVELFGYTHRRDLQGKLISEVHHPDDVLRARLYALTRLLRGPEQYTTYPMRILQGPQKTPFWVQKRVHQVTANGVTTWVTTNTALDQRGTYGMPPIEDIEGLLRDYALQIVAPSHVASQLFADVVAHPLVRSLSSAYAPSLPELKTSDSIIETIYSKSKEIFPAVIQERLTRIQENLTQWRAAGQEAIWIRRGDTAVQMRLEEFVACYEHAVAQHKLCCVRCLYVWEPMLPNPVICPHCQQDWGALYRRKPYGARQPRHLGRKA